MTLRFLHGRRLAENVLLIVSGALLCAYAIQAILVPSRFLAGGIGGLSLFLHYLVPALPVGVLYFVLNIPLFAVGWKFVGRRFFAYSLFGMGMLSALLLIPFSPCPVSDPLLQAIAAGILSGVGSGLMLRSFGSGGGLDILSVILLKSWSVRIGTTVMAFNTLLLLVALFRFPLEIVLYTLIYFFVTSQLINLVVTGLNQRKAVMVISSRWEEIAREIMESMHRGVTIVNGEGGYTGRPLKILYAVITFQELSRFKDMVRSYDPQAFLVVSETLEVMGKGIGNQPHW